MLRRSGARIEERLIGDALSEHMDRVDTGRDLWPTISDLLSLRKRTRFPKIAAVVATTVVVSLFAFLAVVRPWSNSDYQFDYQYTGYLQEEIPPCQPAAGSSVDPCGTGLGQLDSSGGHVSLGSEPRSVAFYLNNRYTLSIAVHLVVRGTYLPNSVRCAPAGGQFRIAPYVDVDYSRSKATHCFADVRVNEYILGSGPPTLTILVGSGSHSLYEDSEELLEQARRRLEKLYREGGYYNDLTQAPEGGIEGREAVLFLGASRDGGVEAWQVFTTWDIEQRDDGTVVAVHPERFWWARRDDFQTHRSKLEMELPAFRQAVSAAHQARLTANGGRIGPDAGLPMIQTDANRITELFTSLGEYDHPNGPPVSPPRTCGMAVPTDPYDPGLMLDCQLLLVLEDGLKGTATLNWDSGTAIGSWDGVTIGGTPTRVTKVELDDEDLTGIIPTELGSLSELTHLDLSGNSLTGDIPRKLGRLDNLEEVRLSGNSLTGCIPQGLKDVTTNDLSSLSLLYCPPAPAAPTAGTATETSQPLTWAAVAGAAKYRVEYREDSWDPWEVDDESITTASRTVDGLLCHRIYGYREREYEFRLSAYGDGTTYAAAWSDPSAVRTATTAACSPPVFGSSSYSFSVAEDAPIGTTVGTVQATDNSGQLAYRITGYLPIPGADPSAGFFGSDFFALDENTGVITVLEDLRRTAYREANLEVTATDANGGVAVVEVRIKMTKSCSSGVAAPNPAATPGLVADCKVLLGLKEALEGPTINQSYRLLNWTAETAMSSWDGITLEGSPQRATVLDLESNGLTGSLPEELGNLDKLQTLYLSGNQFTGCIPPALRDVDENDLDSLDLPNCA